MQVLARAFKVAVGKTVSFAARSARSVRCRPVDSSV